MSDKKNPKVDWGYFAVTPRILRTQYKHLSHTEKWLYTCLKDLCGDKGMCFRTLRVLAQETDLSIGNLSIGIRHLHEAGLVHAEKKRRSNNPTAKEVWHISIVDIWKSNVEYCSKFEHSAENVQEMNNNVQILNNPPLERSISEQKRSNFDDRRDNTEEQQFEERTDEEQVGVSADASTPPAFYSSQEIPVTYNQALAYLAPHGPHEGLDAVQVVKLAQKLWAEAHEEDELPNETMYHIADSTIGNDAEEDAPTVHRIPAIKLNGASHDHHSAPMGSNPNDTHYPIPGPDRGISSAVNSRFPIDGPMGQAEAQEIDPQQTPGVSLQDVQAISAPFVVPEPAQADSNPPAAAGPAQATGERGKPEKPVQQALGTTTEGNIAQERTQEKPKRGRKGKEAVEELPAEVIQLLDDWDSLHRAPLPRTDRLIALAKAGVQAKITPEELKGCRNWLPTTDRPGKPYYRHKGVGLWDIIDKIGEYRSLQNMPIPGVPLVDMKKRDPNEPELGVSGLPKWKGPMPVYD